MHSVNYRDHHRYWYSVRVKSNRTTRVPCQNVHGWPRLTPGTRWPSDDGWRWTGEWRMGGGGVNPPPPPPPSLRAHLTFAQTGGQNLATTPLETLRPDPRPLQTPSRQPRARCSAFRPPPAGLQTSGRVPFARHHRCILWLQLSALGSLLWGVGRHTLFKVSVLALRRALA